MIIQDDLKIIATKLASLSTQDFQIPVYTKDISENIPRPSFHVAQTASAATLCNGGNEIRLASSYKITYFADRRYVSSVQMQGVLLELLARKIEGPNYTIYPQGIGFTNYVDDGIMEMEFDVMQIHTIGAGTEESAAQLMQQLIYDERMNDNVYTSNDHC